MPPPTARATVGETRARSASLAFDHEAAPCSSGDTALPVVYSPLTLALPILLSQPSSAAPYLLRVLAKAVR
jgi:hypothetical protein